MCWVADIDVGVAWAKSIHFALLFLRLFILISNFLVAHCLNVVVLMWLHHFSVLCACVKARAIFCFR